MLESEVVCLPHIATRVKIAELVSAGTIPWGCPRRRRTRGVGSPRITISNIAEDKSFADDLNKGRGIVSSRVILLSRAAEIKPLFYRFVLRHISQNPKKHKNHFRLCDRKCRTLPAICDRLAKITNHGIGRRPRQVGAGAEDCHKFNDQEKASVGLVRGCSLQ